jgi:hypothetical protein
MVLRSLSLLLFLPVVVGLFGLPAHAQSPDVPGAAQSAAQEWLDHLEDRDFEDSWEAAAPPFRDRIERDAWVQKSTRLADSLGGPLQRTLTSAQIQDSLRHTAVDGPFALLKYRSRFSAGHYEELLLLMRQDDAWTVAGYEVTPLQTPDPPMPPLPREESQP